MNVEVSHKLDPLTMVFLGALIIFVFKKGVKS